MREISIANHTLGSGYPAFIVIEAGTTCNGDVTTAKKMVDAAAEANADAIKFMIINPDEFMSDKTVVYNYDWEGGKHSENMYEMFKELEFTPDEWREISDYCKQKKILFYATIDYLSGVDLAESLGVPAYKLSSWDANNFPLIRKMAKTKKPIILDLGPSELIDIQKMVDVIREEGNEDIVFLHCTHATKAHQVNLASMPYLEHIYDCPAGFSADTRDFIPDLVSIGLGTKMIEKRLSLDPGFKGHHHSKALKPDELIDYVAMVRKAEETIGRPGIYPSDEDIKQRDEYFVSVVARRDIAKGETFNESNIACKRPGTGISPEHLNLVYGAQASEAISENTLLSWSHIHHNEI